MIKPIENTLLNVSSNLTISNHFLLVLNPHRQYYFYLPQDIRIQLINFLNTKHIIGVNFCTSEFGLYVNYLNNYIYTKKFNQILTLKNIKELPLYNSATVLIHFKMYKMVTIPKNNHRIVIHGNVGFHRSQNFSISINPQQLKNRNKNYV